ncbi:MAG: DinB family protein [Chloroflexota bacterium]|nr:DinB family protein [Chloroflexota bacterium]
MGDDRHAALAAFDQAHTQFAAAIEETPTAALRYRTAGEDYALGGLAVHVGQVLEKYARLLDAIRAAAFGTVTEPPLPASSEADTALVREGFDDHTRAAVLERVRGAHARVISAVRAVPEDAFRRAAPVTYAGAGEPFATSPADVLGWVHDHYGEHIDQVVDLRSTWATTQT